eukprot:PhF_6_TR2174/c0_g3_i1/m.3552
MLMGFTYIGIIFYNVYDALTLRTVAGWFMMNLTNLRIFATSYIGLVWYNGPLEPMLLRSYEHRHGVALPKITLHPMRNPKYLDQSIPNRIMASCTDTSTVITQLFNVLAIPDLDVIREHVRSNFLNLDANIHAIPPSNDKELNDNISEYLESVGVAHLDPEWFSWYTDRDFRKMKDFLFLNEDTLTDDYTMEVIKNAKSNPYGVYKETKELLGFMKNIREIYAAKRNSGDQESSTSSEELSERLEEASSSSSEEEQQIAPPPPRNTYQPPSAPSSPPGPKTTKLHPLNSSNSASHSPL